MTHSEQHFLKNLRETIISSFEQLEGGCTFERKPWTHATGGGGEIAILRGTVFEKAAVNFSAVQGPHFPGTDASGPFKAMGVSLITHMHNPHAPTVHMNVRYIETESKCWFGGGYDLTPMGFPYAEDTDFFHSTTEKALNRIDPILYPQYSQQAKDYFYIPHRKKERGVGGIFFDHLEKNARSLDIWQTVGNSFLHALLPIYQKRIPTAFSNAEKETQLQLRAHYVEFNLLYDRGTKFGFLSGGNPDAILCSMPPVVKW